MASQKCLVQGCQAPGPVTNSQIRIYSMRFCPFAERTRLVLNAKGINYEVINIHLKNKPSWFFEKNPAGTVPVLETVQGQLICDSVITCEYLDEMFQDKKLFPADPFKKAQQKMLLEEFSKVVPFFYKIPIGKSKGEDTSAEEEELKGKFIKLNEVLVGRKTKFFGGDSLTMIDYLMWPWFERVDGYGVARLLDAAPALKEWMKRMVEDPTVKATMFDGETHKAFLKSFFDGKPNYDLGL
ncbi:glutathione S-transferase omega-1-like [Paramormyrops kingsleyae]|uniref:glutathione S-transferase omega-1-like n=1 Tax=Paramormyrops kingsleyae TaxID=1676925 RepID=UPI003B97A7D3